MEILNAIGAIAGILATILFVIFRNSAQKYVDEKAKNLATIEDTENITDEVEKVKTNYLLRSHAWKQIFEKEYSLLKDVWNATWEFQATARSLRPLIDRIPEDKEKQREVYEERYKRHIGAVNSFRELVFKNKPFIPPNVYESCLSLREAVVTLQVSFETSFMDLQKPDWREIHECGKELDDKLEKLNLSIRNHIYGKISGTVDDRESAYCPKSGVRKMS